MYGSCFTKALSTILEVSEKFVLDNAHEIPECKLRAFYRKELIEQLLDLLCVDHSVYITDDYKQWYSIITNTLRNGDKVLLLYNADHGRILTRRKPTFYSGHYVEITAVDGDVFNGRQSNLDGERKGAVLGKSLVDLYKSSCMFNDFIVDYGKLMKCKICIPKHDVGHRSRCGRSYCELLRCPCVVKCDLGGALVVIRR